MVLVNWDTFRTLHSTPTSKPSIMVKHPKEPFEEKVANPRKEGVLKWYCILIQRKTPQIYERELEKNDFPKELSGLL